MKTPKEEQPQTKSGPVIEYLSETEMVLTYPDGTVSRCIKDRPVVAKDGLWLLEMVSTLVPQFENKKDLKNVTAA